MEMVTPFCTLHLRQSKSRNINLILFDTQGIWVGILLTKTLHLPSLYMDCKLTFSSIPICYCFTNYENIALP